MEIGQVEPFIDATVGMFKSMLGMDCEYLTPYILNRDPKEDWDISGIIGIAGDSKGVVVISFSEALALEATSRLTGRRVEAGDPDVIDTVGELVNIVAGNAKKGLEQYRLSISLPSIVRAVDHQVAWRSNIPIVGIPFRAPYGKFHLAVGLENVVGI